MTAPKVTGNLQGTFTLLFAVLCLMAPSASASQKIKDQYPGSVLYQKPVEFIPNVWSAIGATAPGDAGQSALITAMADRLVEPRAAASGPMAGIARSLRDSPRA